MNELKFGEIITDPNAGRDAIHVHVIPMTAVRAMKPGQKLKNGIVDPFLKDDVQPGQRYWLFLYPGTINGVRHCWSHPAFPEEPKVVEKRRSEADVWDDFEEDSSGSNNG